MAIKHKLKKTALLLLSKGARADLKTKDGEDCLGIAEKTSQLELISELVKKGAKLRPVSSHSQGGQKFIRGSKFS